MNSVFYQIVIALIFIVHLQGFEAAFCQGFYNVTGFQGRIETSSDNSDNYPESRRCVWVVYAHPNYAYLTFMFDYFELEYNWDFLTIYAGLDIKQSSVLYEFTGYYTPPVLVLPPVVTVVFDSDQLVTFRGFAFNWISGRCNNKCSGNGRCYLGSCLCDSGWTGPTCSQTVCVSGCPCVNGAFGSACACAVGQYGPTCKKTTCDPFSLWAAPNGTFSTHTTDEDYDPNMTCSWLIQPSNEAKFIMLQFSRFDLHITDSLEVYDSLDQGPDSLLGKFSTTKPSTLFSETGMILLTFKSDNRFERSGFKATYTTYLCPTCNNGGKCLKGSCICTSDWSGPTCSIPTCPNNCNQKGSCVSGKCQCNSNVQSLNSTQLPTILQLSEFPIEQDFLSVSNQNWILLAFNLTTPTNGFALERSQFSLAGINVSNEQSFEIWGTSWDSSNGNWSVRPNLSQLLYNSTVDLDGVLTADLRAYVNLLYSLNSSKISLIIASPSSTVSTFYSDRATLSLRFIGTTNYSGVNCGICNGVACSTPLTIISDYNQTLVSSSDYFPKPTNWVISPTSADYIIVDFRSLSGEMTIRDDQNTGIVLLKINQSSSIDEPFVFARSSLLIQAGVNSVYVAHVTSTRCPSGCSGNGLCLSSGQCVCNPGFSGASCSTSTCTNNCSGNGKCQNNKCICFPGYFGADCSKEHCFGTTPIYSSSFLTDHSVGSKYLAGSSCAWSVNFPFGDTVSIFFESAQMDWQPLIKAYAAVYDGPSNASPFMVSINSSWLPRILRTTQQAALITFETGSSDSFTGISAYVFPTSLCPNACSGQGSCYNGTCICDPGKTGVNCSDDVVPQPVRAFTRYDILLADWEWRFFSFNVSEGITGFVVNYGRTSNRGNAVFSFGTNELPTAVADFPSTADERKTPQVKNFPSPAPGVYYIAVQGRKTERASGVQVSFDIAYTCPKGCGSKGVCLDGKKCTCFDPCFGGVDCTFVLNACSNHGSCSNGNCTCYQDGYGWFGQNCEFQKCIIPCKNGGICIGPNQCNCTNGWQGADCTTVPTRIATTRPATTRPTTTTQTPASTAAPICDPPCQNGGICRKAGTSTRCDCPSGWGGSTCKEAYCFPACQNGGKCISPNLCQCPDGFAGTACFPVVYTENQENTRNAIIGVVVALGFSIVGLIALIVAVLLMRRPRRNNKMGKAGLDERHQK